MNNWLHIIQDWLYPPTCLLCGDPGESGRDLCGACAAALPTIAVACPRCALPLAAAEPLLCGACLMKPPPFDAAYARFHYQDAAEHLVKALKFAARYPAARLLGTLLAEGLREREEKPEVIIPVPLHASRYRERGFNQSIEIARILSRHLAISLDLNACRRIRRTVAQSQLGSADERRKNIRNAFAARPDLPYGHVAILDDVITTGATAGEVAKALKKAGIARVEVWACTRAGGE